MISLLVVNYRSAALAAEAVRTARAASSAPLQVVIVDNSPEPESFQDANAVIVSNTNRGYAGGINDGRRACTGEIIVVANPDVTFAPASIDKLAAALRKDVAVAGPALFWDDAHQWMLPPGDRHTTLEKLDQVLASRSPRWLEQRDRRRFLRRVAFWSLTQTTEVPMLSGAVMAIRAADFDVLNGFDERFPLYFEETDFLRRITAHRKRIVYVPDAKCRHLYNQSAGQAAADAAAKYAQSEMRFLEKWSGPFMARLLKSLERVPPSPPHKTGEGTNVVTEASPDPSFSTAAGHFGAATLPEEIRKTLKTDFYLRTVDRQSGAVLATGKLSP